MNFEDCTPLPALPDESTTPFPTMLPSILSGRKEGKPDLDEERAALDRAYIALDREQAAVHERAEYLEEVAAQLRQQRWFLPWAGFFLGFGFGTVVLIVTHLFSL